ncbi:MAG: response regulator, partial [Anaerolineales bacterium]|nr:response regulator [Anaerolineales bacterium]
MSIRDIVLIESNAPTLTYLKALLEQAGYAVRTASTGKEGLIEAWRAPTQVVILSDALLDLGYDDLIQKLRSDLRTAQVKIILLSARSQPQEVMAAFKAGVNEFIVKQPGADVELVAKLNALTGADAPRAPSRTDLPSPAGQIVAFLSAKGGTGVSSLCVNTAHLFAERTGKRVVVVDLVLPIGSLGYIVGVDTPGRNLIAATQIEGPRLTVNALLPILSRPPGWNLHLL